jgi:hypothetical protein
MPSAGMLRLTHVQLSWIGEPTSDAPSSPTGGRPFADKRKMVQGRFRILDNGTKWKNLPAEFGAKSTVHDDHDEFRQHLRPWRADAARVRPTIFSPIGWAGTVCGGRGFLPC